MHPTQVFSLLPETFDCSGGELFHKVHTVILRRISGGRSHGRSLATSVALLASVVTVGLRARTAAKNTPHWRTVPFRNYGDRLSKEYL
jgi:hypothetical protein